MIPKGKLLIIGGAEDKGGDSTPEISSKNKDFEHFEILKELLPKGKPKLRIEVVTTASDLPVEMKNTYTKVFKKIGYTNLGFMHMSERSQAYDRELETRMEKASAVFFTGGDQLKISTIIGGTRMHEILLERYQHDKDFVIAGTSAGAMALSTIMVAEGATEEALIDIDIKTSAGLGFLQTCIVDTHFIKRGRFGRLAHAIIINPGQLGIGLGEDTAMIIKNGTEAECRGSGMVIVIDASQIGKTNIAEINERCAVYVENLRIHLLVKGCRFSLDRRQFESPRVKRSKAA
jgi:cyanophycinase